ncbi:MAG: MFS transporter [bacterium]|nr:MFS transporter [bacterium]
MHKIFKFISYFQIPKNLRIVFITIAVSEFAVGIVKPVLPFLIFAANSTLLPQNLSHVERAVYYAAWVSLFKVGSTLTNPIFGILSDILGRKIVLVISILGMVILGVTSIVGIITQGIWLFIIGSFLFGLLWSERTVCTAAINDMTASSDKILNLSKMQFFIGIGICLGPIAGGYIGEFSFINIPYLLPYIVLLIISIGLMFYVSLLFKETYKKSTKNKKVLYDTIDKYKRIKWIFKDKKIYILLGIYMLSQLSWGAYHEYIPVVAKIVFAYDVKHVGILMGMMGISLIIASGILLPVLNKYFTSLTLIKFSCFISAIGIMLCYIFSFFPGMLLSDIVIWISVFPVVAGDVIIFIVLLGLFSEAAGKDCQGTIVGFLYIVGALMWVISAALGSGLMIWHVNASLLICPIAMILLLFMVYFFTKKLKILFFQIRPVKEED